MISPSAAHKGFVHRIPQTGFWASAAGDRGFSPQESSADNFGQFFDRSVEKNQSPDTAGDTKTPDDSSKPGPELRDKAEVARPSRRGVIANSASASPAEPLPVAETLVPAGLVPEVLVPESVPSANLLPSVEPVRVSQPSGLTDESGSETQARDSEKSDAAWAVPIPITVANPTTVQLFPLPWISFLIAQHPEAGTQSPGTQPQCEAGSTSNKDDGETTKAVEPESMRIPLIPALATPVDPKSAATTSLPDFPLVLYGLPSVELSQAAQSERPELPLPMAPPNSALMNAPAQLAFELTVEVKDSGVESAGNVQSTRAVPPSIDAMGEWQEVTANSRASKDAEFSNTSSQLVVGNTVKLVPHPRANTPGITRTMPVSGQSSEVSPDKGDSNSKTKQNGPGSHETDVRLEVHPLKEERRGSSSVASQRVMDSMATGFPRDHSPATAEGRGSTATDQSKSSTSGPALDSFDTANRSGEAAQSPLRPQVRELSIRAGDETHPVDLHLTERGGRVQITVRTPDTPLQSRLREDLHQLVQSLDSAGFRSTTERGQAGGNRGDSQDGRKQDSNQSGAHSQPGSGRQSKQHQESQSQQRPEAKAWHEEIFRPVDFQTTGSNDNF